MPSPQIMFNFFHFKIVHSGAIKYRKEYVIMVFLAAESHTDIKASSFH